MGGSNIVPGPGARILGILTRQIPAAAVGVLTAVVTVLAINHQRAAAPGAAAPGQNGFGDEQASRGSEQVIRKVVVDPRGFDRIADLERRVRELQEARAASETSPAAAENLADPVEARRRVKEMYAELDRAHDHDAPDPRWAPGATSDLVTGLTALGQKVGFTLGATDCKTTTCRATVTWSNYAAARAKGVELVEDIFGGLNCAQKINLLEPSDPNAPYTTRLYLDCADLRTGLANTIVQGQAN